MTLKLVPPVYEWQTWKDGYQPSDEQLGAMGDDEYEAYASCVIYPKVEISKRSHPTYRGDK
jgi:ribosomal protein L31